MVQQAVTYMYIACIVLAGKNLVNTLYSYTCSIADNLSEWRGSLGIGLVIINIAREMHTFSLQSPMTVQHQLHRSLQRNRCHPLMLNNLTVYRSLTLAFKDCLFIT